MKAASLKILFIISIILIFTSCGPRPDINVSSGGITIPSGGSYNFGTANPGELKSATFIIRNSGSLDLELTGSPDKVKLTGIDAAIFSVSSQPGSPIAPGASETFTISFSTINTGTKTAALVITSNDPDEGAYTIALTGCGGKCTAKDKAVNLTSDSIADDQNPAFSHDGESLLFSSKRNGSGDNFNIWKMDILTRQAVPLSDDLNDDNVNMPGSSWNAVSNKICFASARSGNEEIWTMNPDGENLQQITHTSSSVHDRESTLSPDGKFIVFQSDYYRGWEIYTINVETLDRATLTNNSAEDGKPNWSPQGNKIVFQSNLGGNWEIYTMNPDGSDLLNITKDPAAEDTSPSWSPDGSKIVYSSTHGGLDDPEIFVINADGSGKPEQITDYEGYDGAPSFSPNGSSIAFESDRSGNLDIWLIPYAGNPSQTPDWSSVNDFAYQLHNIDLTEIGTSGFDLVIIDYSADGSDAQQFTLDEITALKNSSGGKKIVLAYMSIGEAQNNRGYWNESWDANHDGVPDAGAPLWLGQQDTDRPGNYRVQYWDPAWQAIIFGTPASYLDKIIAAGFDGVYLDHVSDYEYWGPGGASGINRTTAEQDMVNFVKAIASYARDIKGKASFGIFPQNGEALSSHSDYVQVVTGIGREDVWYKDNTAQPSSYTSEVLQNLDVFRNEEKLVLVIDYVIMKTGIDNFYQKAIAKHYVPYATVRTLDALTINAGHVPD